jgi:hypothetical protein
MPRRIYCSVRISSDPVLILVAPIVGAQATEAGPRGSSVGVEADEDAVSRSVAGVSCGESLSNLTARTAHQLDHAAR